MESSRGVHQGVQSLGSMARSGGWSRSVASEVKETDQDVDGHPQLHGKLRANLGHMKLLPASTNKTEEQEDLKAETVFQSLLCTAHTKPGYRPLGL